MLLRWHLRGVASAVARAAVAEAQARADLADGGGAGVRRSGSSGDGGVARGLLIL